MHAPSKNVSGEFVFISDYIRLSMNPAGGKGGSRSGDSVGPDLLGGRYTALAVNSATIWQQLSTPSGSIDLKGAG